MKTSVFNLFIHELDTNAFVLALSGPNMNWIQDKYRIIDSPNNVIAYGSNDLT